MQNPWPVIYPGLTLHKAHQSHLHLAPGRNSAPAPGSFQQSGEPAGHGCRISHTAIGYCNKCMLISWPEFLIRFHHELNVLCWLTLMTLMTLFGASTSTSTSTSISTPFIAKTKRAMQSILFHSCCYHR
ncbi:hypothetical protein VFPPC_18236 [Pochonia chlamydosporia 170]|uniref:Uncharacterized protein n=1 Tax=Pochonia chlamydosporia 170 TaxID=1380566 RepID=A0A219AQP1_METCM|nr:hypothetical protein VFPPC_18236 [Pochonia chlamydosporia 170]OWT42624.1 hypothetical protein VFPPC_18236 [Pochonia chlamydosporia 170]